MNLFNDLAEKELLKSLLFDASKCEWALNNIKAEHFYSKKNKEVYERIMALMRKGSEINIVTLLENDQSLEEFIFALSGEATSASGSRSQGEAVLNTFYKREAQTRLISLSKHVGEIGATPDSIRDKAEELAYFLSQRSDDKTLVPLADVAIETMKELDSIVERGSPGIPTGFRDMDKLGWMPRPKTMTIIGARPAMGKSAFALDLAQRCNVPCAFFSLEMERIEQFERLLSQRTGYSNDELRQPKTIQLAKESLYKHAQELSKLPIYINDAPAISTMQLRMQLKRAIAKWGIRIAFIDYMGYIEDDNDKGFDRRIEMGKYSRAIKQMAKELNIAMVPICQLNRKCEERPDKRPILSDLREVGDLEQDGHLILFLYRENVYNDESNPDEAEVICRKCRGGQTGSIKLKWNGRLTTFSDYNDPINDFVKKDWTQKYD
ncbi:MAG TPA: DnaB-like helicase C-terminal domain-containing protein [Alphaproteobacteria bacterium]|nr:DnaB-like helicase C-terminal domain-containing protein [Alphaproteobacteria bacterium]